jgi:hypothetical protein
MIRRRTGAVLAAAIGLAASAAHAQTPTYPAYIAAGGTRLAPQGVGIVSATSTDGSGAVAAGGTPQILFGGAAPVNGFKVAIPSATPAAFTCWLSDTTPTPSATSAGSYPVQAGGQYSTEVGEKPSGPVYLNCPTTGQVFSAKRW